MPGVGRLSVFFACTVSEAFSEIASRTFASGLGVSLLSGVGTSAGVGAAFSFSFPLSFPFTFSAGFSGDFLPVALLGVALGWETGVADRGFGELRAGKSSSCRTFDFAFAMSFDNPLSTARALTAFLDSGTGVIALLVSGLDAATGGFAGTLGSATGGVCRPTLVGGRDECDRAGDGWALGNENPGGTDGVPTRPRDSNAPGGCRILTSMGSSATRASMLDLTSSREGSSSSTETRVSVIVRNAATCRQQATSRRYRNISDQRRGKTTSRQRRYVQKGLGYVKTTIIVFLREVKLGIRS
jgi:hypothetical protein